MIMIDLMSVLFGIALRVAAHKKRARTARFQAEWKPVGRPESALLLKWRAVGRKTGVHFC
jgi:hypothetical protein